jgi:hypothetical protein
MISHIVTSRNTSGSTRTATIPIPAYDNAGLINAAPRFIRYFSHNNPLFGKQIYLQKPVKYDMCFQEADGIIPSFSGNVGYPVFVPNTGIGLYYPYGWRSGNVGVRIYNASFTDANANTFLVEFKNCQIYNVVHATIDSVLANSANFTTVSTDTLFYNNSMVVNSSGFPNIGRHPPSFGYCSYVNIIATGGAKTGSCNIVVQANLLAPQ